MSFHIGHWSKIIYRTTFHTCLWKGKPCCCYTLVCIFRGHRRPQMAHIFFSQRKRNRIHVNIILSISWKICTLIANEGVIINGQKTTSYLPKLHFCYTDDGLRTLNYKDKVCNFYSSYLFNFTLKNDIK